jgi:hypothetical protein
MNDPEFQDQRAELQRAYLILMRSLNSELAKQYRRLQKAGVFDKVTLAEFQEIARTVGLALSRTAAAAPRKGSDSSREDKSAEGRDPRSGGTRLRLLRQAK